jgi:hypothetical protein
MYGQYSTYFGVMANSKKKEKKERNLLMKKFFIYFTPLLLVGLLVGWYFIKYNGVLLTCEITQDNCETYKIKMFSDGRIHVSYELRKVYPFVSDDSEVTEFYTESEKTIQLTSQEFDTLKQIVEKLQKSKLVVGKANYRTDSWFVTLKIGFKTYEFYLADYQDTPLGILVNKLKTLSPIPINIDGKA